MDLSSLTPRLSMRKSLLHYLLAFHQSQEEQQQQQQQQEQQQEQQNQNQAHVHGHKRNCSLASDDEDEELVDWGEEEDGSIELMQIGTAGKPKNVLILMSDTGGGHRASAEAIKDAFRIEFGDKYRVLVKDLCKEFAGWPLNNMESSYKFMVKHVQLWKVAFHSTSPRWVHCVYLAAIASFYAK